LGYSYLDENKNIKDAYKMIRKAVEKDPKNGAYLDSLGWAYYKMGNYKKARYYLEKAINYEQDPEIEEHLAWTYFKLCNWEKALFYFTKAYEKTGKEDILKEIEKIKCLIKNENH
ncbi:MAG TPA: tetratricopeptide repeat protein, partial [Candidatus Ratteibacteria bacterium]|nr:tetratricopeptide repeat protein [Candidatus Ratteibacteria bacterium]